MWKSVRLLAPVAVIAVMPMGAMTMPTASSATCDDGQFWSPHSNACQALPCPYGSFFDSDNGVCHCNFGWRRNAELGICQIPFLYGPVLGL